ncbi:hypothetical protein EJ06DRAFT_281106 [Trichodelitschia bisporula]|uniref:Uncharacterized protein n=1 Tax=Trichodelitschia bisporula TaxID=703511 RepID=A0A6G1I674_9PEZI|nr:hypothetical protein EJ06DRAFT_281106 [Trichodelitschia bisporula]
MSPGPMCPAPVGSRVAVPCSTAGSALSLLGFACPFLDRVTCEGISRFNCMLLLIASERVREGLRPLRPYILILTSCCFSSSSRAQLARLAQLCSASPLVLHTPPLFPALPSSST